MGQAAGGGGVRRGGRADGFYFTSMKFISASRQMNLIQGGGEIQLTETGGDGGSQLPSSSVEHRISPACLVEEMQDGQDVPEQLVGVGAADREDDPRMIALLPPPGDGEILEVVAIVRDNDSQLLRGERELS